MQQQLSISPIYIRLTNSYQQIKYLLDFISAALLILVLAPMLLILYLILSFYPLSPIFIQKRTGLHGRSFKILKFRTLKYDGNPHPLGAFLRKYSIDEFPQLLNIINGKMSFVGPRPLLPEYIKRYSEREFGRHAVKPGLTCLAQVSGGNNLTWEQQFRYDLFYVKRQGFTLDMNILWKTLKLVLKGRKEETRVEFKRTS